MILILVIFIIIGFFLVIPLNETWGIHIASGAFFLLLTIEILDRLIDTREKRRKEPLKKELISEIATKLSTIFGFVLNLIEVSDYTYGTEHKFHRVLQKLAQRKKLKLSKNAVRLICPVPGDQVTSYMLHDQLFEPAEELGELGTKSLDVLEPPLCASLSRIRDGIRRIRSDHRFTEQTGIDDDDSVEKRLPGEVSSILKQIDSIHEMKIPLYQPWSDR